MYHFLTLKILLDLGYYISPASMGLNEVNSIKLKKRAKVAFTMASQYISQIYAGFMFIITIIFYVNYKFEDFLIFGIPWVIVWGIWTYVGCIIVYWMPAYYYVLCYYIKLRLISINQKLKIFIKSSDRLTKREKYLFFNY